MLVFTQNDGDFKSCKLDAFYTSLIWTDSSRFKRIEYFKIIICIFYLQQGSVSQLKIIMLLDNSSVFYPDKKLTLQLKTYLDHHSRKWPNLKQINFKLRGKYFSGNQEKYNNFKEKLEIFVRKISNSNSYSSHHQPKNNDCLRRFNHYQFQYKTAQSSFLRSNNQAKPFTISMSQYLRQTTQKYKLSLHSRQLSQQKEANQQNSKLSKSHFKVIKTQGQFLLKTSKQNQRNTNISNIAGQNIRNLRKDNQEGFIQNRWQKFMVSRIENFKQSTIKRSDYKSLNKHRFNRQKIGKSYSQLMSKYQSQVVICRPHHQQKLETKKNFVMKEYELKGIGQGRKLNINRVNFHSSNQIGPWSRKVKCEPIHQEFYDIGAMFDEHF